MSPPGVEMRGNKQEKDLGDSRGIKDRGNDPKRRQESTKRAGVARGGARGLAGLAEEPGTPPREFGPT